MNTPDTSLNVPRSAMVFAAGFGTRMGALTRTTPKPMLPLAGRPMIDHTVALLRASGIERIVANTHYLHADMARHLAVLGVENSHEQGEILDTGGGLRHARALLGPGPVVTMNPDAGWKGPNPVTEILAAWRPDFRALLLVVPSRNALARETPGDFSMTEGRLSRGGDYVYTGLQIIDPALVDAIPDRVFSLNRVWDDLIADGALRGVVYEGQWCDIGHPDGLRTAEAMMGSANV